MRTSLLVFFLFIHVIASFSQNNWYVSTISRGLADGSTWRNSSNDLQIVINNAASGDSIFLEIGKYIPFRNHNNSFAADSLDSLSVFYINKPLHIFGGFDPDNGIKKMSDPRILSNKLNTVGTIFSGDVLGDDVYLPRYDALGMDSLACINCMDNRFSLVKMSIPSLYDTVTLNGISIIGTRLQLSQSLNNPSFVSAEQSAVNVVNGTILLQNCKIENNFSNNPGAGVVFRNSRFNIDNSYFIRNYNNLGGGGGAVYATNFYLSSIQGSIFEENVTKGFGGALYLTGGNVFNVNYCKFYKQRAYLGGAIYVDFLRDFNVYHSDIRSNIAIDGAAVRLLNQTKVWLYNSVVTGNYSIQNKGSLFFGEGVSIGITSFYSTIVGNRARITNIVNKIGLNTSLSYNNVNDSLFLIPSGMAGFSDFSPIYAGINPELVQAIHYSTAPTMLGNFELKPCSPLIDATFENTAIVQFDYAGNSRVYNNILDFGAYEFNADQYIGGQSYDTIVACEEYRWLDSINYTSNTDAQLVLDNTPSCYFAKNLHLIINHPDTTYSSLLDCEFSNIAGDIENQSGTYYQSVYNSQTTCWDKIIYNLTITNPDTAVVSANACDSLSWRNQNYYTSGVYSDIVPNAVQNICDSVYLLNLQISNNRYWTGQDIACESFLWRNQLIQQSGTFYDTVYNVVDGFCDSIYQINVTIFNNDTVYEQIASCEEEFVWNNLSFNNSGIYSFTSYHTVDSVCNRTYILDLTMINISKDVYSDGYKFILADSSGAIQWYHCETNLPMLNETNMIFVPTIKGHYKVKITKDGCSVFSDCFYFDNIGVSEHNNGIKVYPNPVNDLLYIQNLNNKKVASIELATITGAVLEIIPFQYMNGYLDVSKYPSGVYFVKINMENAVYIEKIIKL